MKKALKPILLCLCAVFLVTSLSIIAFPDLFINFYISRLERKFDLGIDYSLAPQGTNLFKRWCLEDISVSSSPGYRLDIREMTVIPRVSSLMRGEMSLSCLSRGIKFHTSDPLIESAYNLFSAESPLGLGFDSLDADITIEKDVMTLKSDLLELNIKGVGFK